MKTRRVGTGTRIASIALAILACVVTWYMAREWYRHRNPAAAFVSITGLELPRGVRADAYSSVRSGIFSKRHYWTLSGDAEAIRQFGVALGLDRAPEDARLVFSSRKPDSGPEQAPEFQNRQYIFMRDGTEALYVQY